MPEFPDYTRTTESQDLLLDVVLCQELDDVVCPSCGSLFLMHVCHANPVKGKGMAEAKPKIKGISANLMVVDEIQTFGEL